MSSNNYTRRSARLWRYGYNRQYYVLKLLNDALTYSRCTLVEKSGADIWVPERGEYAYTVDYTVSGSPQEIEWFKWYVTDTVSNQR